MTLRLFTIIVITTALLGPIVEGLGGMRPGGTSGEKSPTPEVQEIMNSIKPQLEQKLGRVVPEVTLLSYKTQIVNGINYFAKVDIGEDDVVHLRVHQTFDQNVELSDMLYPKDRSHPIAYF